MLRMESSHSDFSDKPENFEVTFPFLPKHRRFLVVFVPETFKKSIACPMFLEHIVQMLMWHVSC